MKKVRITSHPFLTTTIGLLAVIIGSNAMAFSITYDSISGYATGIKNLVVDNKTYDVDFVVGSYDAVYDTTSPVFLSNQSGADNAANAIMNALNAEEALPQVSVGPNEVLWVAYEFVPNDYFRSTGTGHATLADPWQRYGNLSGSPDTEYSRWLFAKFTQTPVNPVPTLANWALILLSMLLGFVGVAGLRRFSALM